MNPAQLQSLLPYGVIAAVLIVRWRTMSRPRVLRTPLLVIPPLIVAAVVVLVLTSLPPAPWEGPFFAAGLLLGALAGWQRARLLKLEREAGTGRILMRQSPLAVLAVIALLAVRRLAMWEAGVEPGASPLHNPATMLAIAASLGFALGMVWASRFELWRRARTLG